LLIFYSSVEEPTSSGKKSRSRGKKGLDIMSKVIQLLSDKNSWIPLEEKKQYEMLGFHHDTSKLLYIEDFTKLKCCPHPIVPDYIWKDTNLTKHSSGGVRNFTLGENNPDKSVYVLRNSHCAGVKVLFSTSLNFF